MALSRVQAIPITTFDAADLSEDLQPINPDGIPAACYLLRITNKSDEAVFISFDGVNTADFLDTNEIIELYTQNNALPNGNVALWPKGQMVYVTGSEGTGDIYLAGYFQSQS